MSIVRWAATSLCYMRVDAYGCFIASPTHAGLRELIGAKTEILIPIFPTVFPPSDFMRAYYNAVLENVKAGDKVLVIGCGSGADAWLAWLKAQTTIRAIDINPEAILNTYAAARIGGFRVRPLCGDIREMTLPGEFRAFDCVLAAPPFMGRLIPMEQQNYHDGDDGTVTGALMRMLPSLLKKGGRAVIAGTAETESYITLPMKKTGPDESMVYVLGGSL